MTKKTTTITILTILTLAIIVGGFWYTKNQQKENVVIKEKQGQGQEMNGEKGKENRKEEKNDGQKVEELKVEDIDTSNWKEYCNKEYGFCVRYPEDWIIKQQNSDELIISLNSPQNEDVLTSIKNGKIYGEGYMNDVDIFFWKSVLEESENMANNLQIKTLGEYINKSQMIDMINKIIIGNQNAYEVIRYGFGAYYTIMIEHNTHLYQIMFGNVVSKNELTNVHKAIIKSFKFTK